MLERGLNRFQAVENVGVIELDVIDDRDLRQVMNELASFVEKGSVVLVPFDNKPFTVGETGALAKVVWDAADQVAGVEPIVLEHPGKQRRGGGLAMGPGDDQGTFAADKDFL